MIHRSRVDDFRVNYDVDADSKVVTFYESLRKAQRDAKKEKK